MIYTLTPNPALDIGGTVESLVANEKAYVYDETRFPGGNGINAARIIRKIGLPVIAGGFLGGEIGREIKFLLKQEGVHCRFVPIEAHSRIGVTVSDRKTHLQTRLSFPGPKINSQDAVRLENWIRAITRPSLLIIGGSLPPGFSISILKKIAQTAQSQKIPIIIDIPGKLLKPMLSLNPLFIKPNLIEFQELIGKKVSSIRAIVREAKTLNPRIQFICISSVEKGALLITPRNTWFGQTPKIQLRSTVGAGDSMVGAMSTKLWQNRRFFFPPRIPGDLTPPSATRIALLEQELLRFGLAAAAATLRAPGTMLGDLKMIERYFKKIKIKKIT